MPDFLSRLVKRTFGLMTVAQPATGSIFDPELSVKSDYIHSLSPDNEPVSNQDGINIDRSLKSGITSQHDNQPAFNWKKSFNKDNAKPPDQIEDQDIQSDFTPISRPLYNIEPLKKNDSDFPEQIESNPLHQMISGQDNRYIPRLVKRTFGLMTVAQPATSPIFDPDLSVKSDYIQSLSPDNEPVSNQDGINIDRSLKPGITSRHDNQPAFNWEKSFNKDNAKPPDQIEDQDIQSDFTPISRSSHNIEPLKKNDSDFPEQIESVPLHQISGKDNRYLYKSPAKLAQDNKFLYKIDYDILESIESEPLYAKSRNGRSTLPSIPKSMLLEEQSHGNEQDPQEHVEPGQKDFKSVRENTNILMPLTRQVYDEEQSQSLGIISLEQMESKPSHLVGLQKSLNINRRAASEPWLPYEKLSVSKPSSGKNSGENSSGQKEPFVNKFVDNIDSHVGKTLLYQVSDSSLTSVSSSSLKSDQTILKSDQTILKSDQTILKSDQTILKSGKTILKNRDPASRNDFYPPSHLHSDAGLSPIIPSRKNLKRMSAPKANATLGQMDNMLIKQHAVAPRSPPTIPTIKVTIGRIEVRAVKPPLAPQPQTPPQRQHPILSLDDYLKQSNG